MKEIKLDKLESELSEEAYLKAEQFHSTASFSVVDHVKRYHWQIEVSNGASKCRTFLHVTPTFIKSATCTCTHKNDSTWCVHINASLIFLRGYQLSIKNATKQEKRKQFNTKTILQTISHEQLKQFVASYSTSDAKLSTALKVHFARQVPSDDLEEKYTDILNKILRPITSQKSYTIPAINYFVKNGKELLEQSRDAYALENYVEASMILHLLLERSIYASTKVKVENEKLLEFTEEIFVEIRRFFQVKMAPRLRRSFAKELLSIYEKSTYPLDYRPGIIEDLFMPLGSKSEIVLAVDAMNNKLDLSRDDLERTRLFYQLLLANSSINTSIKTISSKIRIQHLQGLFKLLLQNDHLKLAKLLLSLLQEYEYLAEYKFEDVQIIIGRRLKEDKYLAEALSRKYERTKEITTLDELLSMPLSSSRSILHNTYQSIINNGGLSQQDLAILNKLEQFDLLVDHVITQNWYEAAPRFIPQIADKQPEVVRYFTQKYMDASLMDSDIAKRNQIYIMQGLRAIYDDKFATEQIQQMEDFHKQLEEIWLPEL